jgi:cytochrome c biogenesis factor
MLLNFYFYLLNFKVLAVYSLWVVIFPLSRSGYVDFIDIYSRTLVSDFFTNTYYYFWTAFWYIPTLLFFLLLIMFFVNNLHTNKLVLLVTPLPALFMYELLDYWNLNTTYTNLTLNSDNLNLLLTNSINKYHPMVLYFIIAFIASNFIIHVSVFWCTNYSWDVIPNFSSRESFGYKLLYITVTLFLGSWWALQEGSWGGWWNWDASEVFGLLIMVTIVLTLHRGTHIDNYYLYFVTLRLYLLSLLIVYIFIQLNCRVSLIFFRY